MKDTFKNPTGYFSIEVNKNGKVIDKYEHQNQIMFRSKEIMREAMIGNLTNVGENIFINKFLLGNMGHEGDNILNPKNFDYTQEDLFSVEDQNGLVYPIRWDASGNIVDEGYDPDFPNTPTTDTTLTISRLFDNNNFVIEYKIVIPEENGNGPGNSAIAYTEAGMYANLTENNDNTNPNFDYGYIFAMRTFPAKVKDSNSSLTITWRIIF